MPPLAVIAAASVIGAVGGITEGIVSSVQSKDAAKKASEAQANATASLQQAQDTASTQAQNALTAKRAAAASSTDIFTSPLGLTTQANVARKTLTGQ